MQFVARVGKGIAVLKAMRCTTGPESAVKDECGLSRPCSVLAGVSHALLSPATLPRPLSLILLPPCRDFNGKRSKHEKDKISEMLAFAASKGDVKSDVSSSQVSSSPKFSSASAPHGLSHGLSAQVRAE